MAASFLNGCLNFACGSRLPGVKSCHMSLYSLLLSNPRLRVKIGKGLWLAILQILLLPAFVFCGLTSLWSFSNSSGPVQKLWYGCSSWLLFGVAGFMVYELMARVVSRRGGPSGMLPLAGAACPVPIRPTPRLVRSAAEPLPSENKRDAKAYRAREIVK